MKMIDIKNIEDNFKEIGIELKDSKGNYKSMYNIFEEISKVWHELKLNDYIEFYKNSTDMYIYTKATGEIYSKEYKWGKSEFWIDEATKILSNRGLSLKKFGGIDNVCLGDSSYPIIMITFKNGIELYAEEQSPFWAVEENNKILECFK